MIADGRLEPGTLFAADFRIVRLLAAGGMGAVYLAEQLSTGRERALKVLHPQLGADPQLRARFVEEARLPARIASDHIVEVIAAGVDAVSKTPWLAMELLVGQTLAECVAAGPLAVGDARAIFRQLCHGLDAAHGAGVVHRDVKPENVFLARARRSDATFDVKVLDFGIAKWVQESRTSGRNSQVIGTPFWMAPEQLEPGSAIDARTDVWALGLLAFNALVGQSYWKSAATPDAALGAMISEVLLEPLAPASVRARACGARIALPPAFDAWFARCVARASAGRFARAGDAMSALEPVLRAMDPATRASQPPPVPARPAPPLPPTRGASPARDHAARRAQLHAALETGTLDAATLTALLASYAETGEAARARRVAATLAFVRGEAHAPDAAPPGATARGRLDARLVMHALLDPTQDPFASKVLAAILGPLRRLRALPLAQFNLDDGDRAGRARGAVALAQAFDRAADVLGVAEKPRVIVQPWTPGGLAHVPSTPWASLVGAGVFELDAAALWFEVGRHVAMYRAECYARVLFGEPGELPALVLAAARAVDRTVAVPDAVLETSRVLAVELTMDPVAHGWLVRATRAFRAQGGDLDPEVFARGIERTACRAGFLLGGDLAGVRTALALGAADRTGLTRAEKLADVVRFSVSEAYFALREAIDGG